MFLIAVVLTACTTVGPDYEPPKEIDESPTQWTGELEGGLTAADLDPQTLTQWWKTLEDPTLNSLVERAIAANLDLRTAEAQLRQARAQRGVAGSAQFPTIDAAGSATRSGTGSTTTELYSTSFDAGWELDLFGGTRRAIEASDADLQAAQETRRDVLISVLAEVALNYAELRTFQSQLAVARENLRNQEESQAIVQAQFDAGAVTELDLSQATANVERTRSEIPQLEQNVDRAMNRLAVLIGQPPGSLHAELKAPQALPTPPVQVAVGVPAETLRRRPDVRVAERRLAAETARIGVATAELYPKFTLSGTIGLEALSLSNLTSSDSQTFRIGPGFRWNIFDGGRARQRIEVQDAVQEQAMIAYEASILKALEDVENAITAYTQEQLRYRSLNESAQAAERAATIAKTRYDAGASDFLTVLDSERTVLGAQSSRAASEGTIVSNLIRLYKALGGGWTPEEPEAAQ
ncbi:MAG: efflux transporter outer membrane subunit [Gammaproteobacteria bacterium]